MFAGEMRQFWKAVDLEDEVPESYVIKTCDGEVPWRFMR